MQETESKTPESSEEPKRITLQASGSSQIKAMAYDEELEQFYIEFRIKAPGKRSIYRYSHVPPYLAESLLKAKSAGTVFGANLKPYPHTHPYYKLSAEEIELGGFDIEGGDQPSEAA